MNTKKEAYINFLKGRGCTIRGDTVYFNDIWVGKLEYTHFRLAVCSLETADAVTGKTFVEDCPFVTLPNGSRRIPYLKRRWR